MHINIHKRLGRFVLWVDAEVEFYKTRHMCDECWTWFETKKELKEHLTGDC